MSIQELEIIAFLRSLGWSADDRGGMVNQSYDYRVDTDGDSGYPWELQRFSDGDIDGVATARWVSMDIEGDTIAELEQAIKEQRA